MTVSLSSAALAQANAAPTTATAQAAAQENPTTAALNKISPALGKAHERVRNQLQSESTSLSQLGKYKATVSELQGAAQAMSQLGATTSVADASQTVERFIAAYNQAIQASRPDESSSASGTLAASRRTLTNTDTSRSQLAKLGLTRQPDGTLKLDTAALKKALSAASSNGTPSDATTSAGTGLSTLSQLGKAIGKRADSELSDSSRLAFATNLFSGKATLLKKQQTSLLEAATQMASQANNVGSTGVNTGNWSSRQALRQYTA